MASELHPAESDRERPREARSRLRRLPRTAFLVFTCLLGHLVLFEFAWRLWRTSLLPGLPPRVTAEDVPYTLHPYFQTVMPAGKGAVTTPDLAGWVVDPPGTASDPGRKRILFLGGSSTANSYPSVVRERLEPRVGPTTCYVLASEWHCSLHSLYKFWTYGDAIQPDLTVVLDNMSDFYRGFTSPSYSLPEYRPDFSHYSGSLWAFWLPGHARFDARNVFYARPVGTWSAYDRDDTPFGLLTSIARDSTVLFDVQRWFRKRAAPVFTTASFPDEALFRSRPEFERNLENLALSCRVKGVKVLFLTTPFTLDSGKHFLPPGKFLTNDGNQFLSPEQFVDGIRGFNDVVRELADEPAAWVFPLDEHIRDAGLFVDEVHLTPLGQRKQGELVAEFVLEEKLLDP